MKLDLNDKKALIIGLVASFTAIIVWDIVKQEYQIFNYKKDEKNR